MKHGSNVPTGPCRFMEERTPLEAPGLDPALLSTAHLIAVARSSFSQFTLMYYLFISFLPHLSPKVADKVAEKQIQLKAIIRGHVTT